MIQKRRTKSEPTPASLMVRLDQQSKDVLKAAAELRRISVSDYVRTVTVSQARLEVESARSHVVALTPQEQLAFWTALHGAVDLTPAQSELAQMMRGEK